MKLDNLLKNIDYIGEISEEINIDNIAYDSRLVTENSCFIAIKGNFFDGHNFISKAVEKGAKIIIVDNENFVSSRYPIVKVDNTRIALSQISSNFFKNPSANMNIIGITGTNGKTAVNQIIKNILDTLKSKCGSLGTLGFIVNNDIINTGFTTPESLELHGMLKLLKDSDINCAVLEVSSHSLSQNRVDNIDFDVAVFTNLTQDHLDYHETMSNYFRAKSKLFSNLKNEAFSIINTDDSYGKIIYDSVQSNKISYGFNENADISVTNISLLLNRTEFSINIFKEEFEFKTNLIGEYNVLNIMASIGAIIALGYNPKNIINTINDINFLIPGRMELLYQKEDQYIYIDYAHTPDAYEKIFTTIKKIDKSYQIITLFGCGGDRDKDKRSKMACIAEKYCSQVFITSDNPRNESLDMIISDIVKGFRLNNYEIIKDRESAIKSAIDAMRGKSILFILGKGRENYQIINNEKFFFSDADTIKNHIYAN